MKTVINSFNMNNNLTNSKFPLKLVFTFLFMNLLTLSPYRVTIK